ncbi:cell wall metabolism sensor histidine kinase WalK [Dongia mobilis]|jgi:two-component system cell cycle sensor histidine kinase PleC|uniref:sensor histidine kinase n=1 Tax=Dongia sp. TaxID=1977262 RepID=UPI0026F2C602
MLQTKVDMKPEPQERSEAELRPAEIAATDQPLKVQAFTLTAQHLASDAPAIGPETTGARVLELFRSNTALPLLAVTDAEGVVYGAVERDRLLSVFAQPLWFDVYFKRSIQALMNRQPLVVDEETPLDEIKRLITASHPDAIQSGFLVTRGGRFSGIGTMAKLLELTVEQAQRRLEQLDEARHAAEFAASSRAKFLATMSHELRTPLNAIIGFSELLLGLPGAGRDAPQLPDYIGDIRQSGQHLLGLINDILDYSKLEAGALTLNAVTFQLDEMLQSALGVTRGQAASRNVHLELAPTAPISVLADERRLRQVVINLLSNAIKFSPNEAVVTLRAHCDLAGSPVIEIEDRGIGIKAEDIDRVFEPFVQVENHLNRKNDGTGLGLPLSRQIMALHGGALRLSSRLGHGTVAIMTLPPQSMMAAAIPQPAAAGPSCAPAQS